MDNSYPIYYLNLSKTFALDIGSAVLDKLQINERHCPADEFRGRF
jgi:hypothetical protein